MNGIKTGGKRAIRRGAFVCKWVMTLAAVALNAICLQVFVEAVCRGSLDEALFFAMERTTTFAAYGSVLIGLATMALAFFLGRMAPAVFLTNAVFLLMSIVNHVKMTLRGEPFLFSDFAFAREALQVAGGLMNGGIVISRMAIGALVLFLILIPLLFAGVSVLKKKRLARLICAAAVGGMCAGWCVLIAGLGNTHAVPMIQDDYWDRGFIVAFSDTMIAGKNDRKPMETPEGYTREAVVKTLERYEGTAANPDVLPDVLFVMSESLFDASSLFPLSEDPLAYFKQLQEDFWGGNCLSPVYGGGTCASEYEVLTGYPASDTSDTYNTAKGVICQDMDGVASVLSGYGYYTQAIHPNRGSFYGRRSVYQRMGFDRTLFREELDPPPKTEMEYATDEYLFEEIIRAYEERPKERPWFCHTITIQNHGGYGFEFSMDEVKVETELGESEMLNARNYVNMLKLSDRALRELIAYFDAQENPVMIVIWGDHAPSFSQMGMERPIDPVERMRFYTTPILIYNNYGLEVTGLPETMSAYRLGAYVLKLLGMEADPYFNYISSEDCISITMNGLVERDGKIVEDQELRDQTQEVIRLLHYDRVFGEKYGKEI